PGPDGIHPRVLIELKNELAELLLEICNLSLKSSVVPEDWRVANVTPIFKKGSRGDPGNYRPVSLTSVPGKMVEAIIKNKIAEHIQKHGLMRQSQHGFSEGKSCLTNLMHFFEGVSKHVDNGEPVDIVYLDFQKAFDKVPHERLLKKLQSHGIGGRVLLWIKNWLKDRKQRVGLRGQYSQWRRVVSGVPQGSVLGPLLFNVFINDLEMGITSEVIKFADDTKLFRVVKSQEECERLQEDLARLGEWACKWQMKFNVDKCKVMHVGKRNPNYSYVLQGSTLGVTDQERDLGVVVDDTLKPSAQCAAAARKANRMLGVIRKGMESRCADVIMPLYRSMEIDKDTYRDDMDTKCITEDNIYEQLVKLKVDKAVGPNEIHIKILRELDGCKYFCNCSMARKHHVTKAVTPVTASTSVQTENVIPGKELVPWARCLQLESLMKEVRELREQMARLRSICKNKKYINEMLHEASKNSSNGEEEARSCILCEKCTLLGIHLRVLKETGEVLEALLSDLFNVSLEYGVVLEDWRRVYVILLHKSGSKEEAGIYRPVSLISVSSSGCTILSHCLCPLRRFLGISFSSKTSSHYANRTPPKDSVPGSFSWLYADNSEDSKGDNKMMMLYNQQFID
ncbi:uncharacterized protein LOC115464802, partial [Microcaecilia unicolor]|uniref:Uncharacterized protein LOC115464802 n=1 Tax=Microcaecilia unicolor TaxID=1415580 RepID=A0A6P7X5Z7_9AMPH